MWSVAIVLNPTAKESQAYVTSTLGQAKGPVIAATDYMKSYAEQIRAFLPQSYHVLGTDGFGPLGQPRQSPPTFRGRREPYRRRRRLRPCSRTASSPPKT